jgi:hypothetical protein
MERIVLIVQFNWPRNNFPERGQISPPFRELRPFSKIFNDFADSLMLTICVTCIGME